MRRRPTLVRGVIGTTAFATAIAGAAFGITGQASARPATPAPAAAVAASGSSYVVMFAQGTDGTAAVKAARAAGGTVVKVDRKLGFAVVQATDAAFATKVGAAKGVLGAARDRVIGRAPDTAQKELTQRDAVEGAGKGQVLTGTADAPAAGPAEPLANRQWDMRQIGATVQGSYAVNAGDKRVLVGVIDTGIDGKHPDITPNFDKARSVNFVVDNPLIDSPKGTTTCEHPPACIDPADEDDNGHGTHVASTIASPLNGLGIAGVAPKVTLVNIRAGQDSGYFFLQPTIEALEYAGDIGVDVVNMSFYTDPWLFNCLANPADSPAERTEQRVIRELTQRAVTYAIRHGVTPIAAEGNEATDLGHPTTDTTSPDFPEGAAKTRTIDNSCITVPTETRGVIAVSSTGISKRKAYYSNYGVEQTEVAAPGGDVYDTPDTTRDLRAGILAAYPENVARAAGQLDDKGVPTPTSGIIRDCKDGVCGYYQYLQGTSMAAPHAVGVAALLIARYGHSDGHGGWAANPSRITRLLYRSSLQQACPEPRLFHYDRITPAGAVVTADHLCEGTPAFNGFYGHGIVNAYRAVAGR